MQTKEHKHGSRSKQGSYRRTSTAIWKTEEVEFSPEKTHVRSGACRCLLRPESSTRAPRAGRVSAARNQRVLQRDAFLEFTELFIDVAERHVDAVHLLAVRAQRASVVVNGGHDALVAAAFFANRVSKKQVRSKAISQLGLAQRTAGHTGSLVMSSQCGHMVHPLALIVGTMRWSGPQLGLMQRRTGHGVFFGTQSQHGATRHCLVVESTDTWPAGQEAVRSAHVLGSFWHLGQRLQLFWSRGVTMMLPAAPVRVHMSAGTRRKKGRIMLNAQHKETTYRWGERKGAWGRRAWAAGTRGTGGTSSTTQRSMAFQCDCRF